MTDQGFIISFDLINGSYVFAWDDEYMYWSCWMNIQESDYLVVTVNSSAGAFIVSDTAEDAI